jgi:hypothetical protein
MISAHIQGKQGLWFPNVKDAYVPVAWFDEVSDISPQGVHDFVRLYQGMSVLYGASAMGLVGLALTVGIPPVYRFFKRHKRIHRARMLE